MKILFAVTLTLAGLLPLSSNAVELDRVNVDLKPLITAAARNPDTFAVALPKSVSIEADGQWTQTAGVSSWQYSVQVPKAVSLSFHARANLPIDAVLMVTGGDQVYRYDWQNVHDRAIWSRIAIGDTLSMTLTVPTTERDQVAFTVDELQAGYRGFGKIQNHPVYRALLARGEASTPSCVTNYECEKSSANDGPSRATVAIVVANTGQCTGTLLNDVPGDYANYILTARHCEDPSGNGKENPDASRLTFYWNATTPCGQTLDTIYNAATAVTSVATTLTEQFDTWLVRLNTPPPDGVYYAGWDATGGSFSGGYGIHHADGLAKQYVAYYGQPYMQETTYFGNNQAGQQFQSTTTLLNTSASIGSTDHGASGSAFFSANNNVVGSLTGGNAECPTTPPTAPSASYSTSVYTALSAAYDSTADQSSSAPTTTIADYLDPKGTGVLVTPGQDAPPPAPPTVSISVSPLSIVTGSSASLEWASTNASSCVASGSWSGSEPPTGSENVTPTNPGSYTYTLTCGNSGGNAAANTTLTVTASSSSSGSGAMSGSTSSGGGGSMGWPALLGLLVAKFGRLVQRSTRIQQPRANRSAVT